MVASVQQLTERLTEYGFEAYTALVSAEPHCEYIEVIEHHIGLREIGELFGFAMAHRLDMEMYPSGSERILVELTPEWQEEEDE